MATFQEKLQAGWKAGKFLSVGLDPHLENIPRDPALGKSTLDRLFNFCHAVARATASYALAFKPNLAFFKLHGADGLEALQRLCSVIHDEFPDVVLILDAKYGDIGNTNEAASAFAFDVLGVDGVTLNPYVGGVAHLPFLCRTDKGCIFLVKTSNTGAEELQDRLVIVDGEELERVLQTSTAGMLRPHKTGLQMLKFHELVAHKIAHEWNVGGNCGVVVGATYPGDLSTVRAIVGGTMPILIPGIGKQGGDLRETVNEGLGSGGMGMIINASRSICHASSGADFAIAAASEAQRLHEAILAFRGECDFPA